jgi:hypothetical protein
MPKSENFDLKFFTSSEPIWVGDLGTEANNIFFSFGTLFRRFLVFYRMVSVWWKNFFVTGALRENFSLAFFTLREHIWVGDLGTEPKNPLFIIWPLISNIFGFLPYTECAVKKKI